MLSILSLFSGIGAFEKALENIEVPYELVNFCEFDKYAVKSYCAIHGVEESVNLGDITKVDESKLPKDIDILTYGFPCQDISLAGKQKGLFNDDGTQTRSGLFFEALRIIEATKPKIAIAENVKNLVGKKFNAQFQVVLASLESAGYNNYWKVLNAKDFGVPQNRERVFIVSIRKDIDHGLFQFPEAFPLEKRLKDILEDKVDETYYLSDEQVTRLSGNVFTQANLRLQTKDYCDTLLARDYKDPKCVQVAQMYPNSGNPQAGRIYDSDGISPTMDTCSGGNRMPKVVVAYDEQNQYIRKDGCVGTIMTDGSSPKKNNRIIEMTDDARVLVREATKKGYAEAAEGDSINLEQPNSTTRRGRVGKGVAQTLTTSCNQAVAVAMRGRYNDDGQVEQQVEVSDREYANAITTVQKDSLVAEPTIIREAPLERDGWHRNATEVLSVDGISRTISTQSNNLATKIKEPHSLRIRKLTPKECFRLMGFDDESFHKAEAVNSNTQLYKQAGNSIVVDVLEELFCMMLDEDGNIYV